MASVQRMPPPMRTGWSGRTEVLLQGVADRLAAAVQHTPWLLEKVLPLFSLVTPSRFRSFTVEQIARAMVDTSVHTPAASGVYHYAEMVADRRAPSGS